MNIGTVYSGTRTHLRSSNNVSCILSDVARINLGSTKFGYNGLAALKGRDGLTKGPSSDLADTYESHTSSFSSWLVIPVAAGSSGTFTWSKYMVI